MCIGHDVVMFREKMNNWMTCNTDANSRIDDGATKFLKSMKKYFATTTNLTHACTTTLVSYLYYCIINYLMQ